MTACDLYPLALPTSWERQVVIERKRSGIPTPNISSASKDWEMLARQQLSRINTLEFLLTVSPVGVGSVRVCQEHVSEPQFL